MSEKFATLWKEVAFSQALLLLHNDASVVVSPLGELVHTEKINNSSVVIVCDEPIHTRFQLESHALHILLFFHSEQHISHSLPKTTILKRLFDMQTMQQTEEGL